MSTTVTADTEVDVPVRTAYDQWTQFESFPHFMNGVESVRQLDDTSTHWIVSIAGVTREFDADVSDQVPDDHVAWRSTTAEVHHRGRVDFRPVSADRTRVDLTIEWEPEGFVEKAGAALQLDDAQVKRDLHRFKEFIEERRAETGAWRGEVHGAQETAPGGTGLPGTATTGTAGTVNPPMSEGVVGSDPDLRA
ncbi:SRPBCC family protein [Agromyces aurantiacus]|uniref:SRPBCC family protein n=1 Tax=Agromyces aurantiacus TaxID=165814 RepID=A0ABV9R318_9MICO|nr:SRPBCC family protein [Agromyces aurantiacus]MBM7503205.1 putative membrane protein [Agromyces aurantiacus]